jgi:pimeloyl-ACP methyl ester carboxylesterase
MTATDTTRPAWLDRALKTPYEDAEVEVAGATVHYLRWGEPGRPGVVLIHGGGAHAHWWSHLAPFLLPDHHVVAVDLSGHGDSGGRDTYATDLWVDEVLAVADAVGMARPVVVGHSMGGFVATAVAARAGNDVDGLVIVDSDIGRPDPETQEGERGHVFRRPGVYETREQALARFRLFPPQPCDQQHVLDHLASHSVHETDRGWTWKFDPRVFGRSRTSPSTFGPVLQSVTCRVAVMVGEHSDVVPPEVAAIMADLLGRRAPFVEIPDAHHHLIIDQPLAFVAALRALLADWDHTIPLPGSPGAPRAFD